MVRDHLRAADLTRGVLAPPLVTRRPTRSLCASCRVVGDLPSGTRPITRQITRTPIREPGSQPPWPARPARSSRACNDPSDPFNPRGPIEIPGGRIRRPGGLLGTRAGQKN
jgi:hypothetical protein